MLLQLESLGIHGNLLSWFDLFLTKIFQRVVVNGSFSEWLSVGSGVPQGSVLGPLLFILHVVELHKIFQHSDIKLFVDYIALYKAIVSLCDNELLQDDLIKLYGWCKKWLLKLNPLKCESICLSYKHLPLFSRWPSDSSKISIVWYLGVFINSKLKWGDYVKHLAAKASRLLNYLCHTLFSCSSSVKATAYKTAYKAIVRPILEYASSVWYLHNTKEVSQLELVKRRATCRVCGSRWNSVSHNWTKLSDTCLQELNWLPLQTRRSFFSISLAHDILYNRVTIPFPRLNFLPPSLDLTCIPSSTINPYRYSFFINTPFLWNITPLRILQLSNVKVFRATLHCFPFV